MCTCSTLTGWKNWRNCAPTPGGESVRVLMTSGLDFKDQCLENGANGFIQKPFMPDDLLSALRSVG